MEYVMILLFIASLILPAASSYYFHLLMKFIRVRRGVFLISGAISIWMGYVFFMLPWIFIGETLYEMRIIAYLLSLMGLFILSYGILRIYIDWKEVMK